MKVLDHCTDATIFHDDVIEGLSRSSRALPCKYFYDERGSALFEQICELDEYYLTRTELSIMTEFADEMAEQIGPDAKLVEYGSGSSIKTRILLDQLQTPVAYVPVDISRDHLASTAKDLARRYPDMEVLPVCADFMEEFVLPEAARPQTHTTIYFPGSTIGNNLADVACDMLARIAQLCGAGGGLLIGIDLQKDAVVINRAYNDASGVTAQFNLNLLHRINCELDGDIQVDQFEHWAKYDETLGHVEIGLISRCDQSISVGERSFEIGRGEMIHTEYSCKYTIEGFAELADAAGLSLRQHWTDRDQRFAVLFLTTTE